MTRKIIAAATLTALVNLTFAGCSKVVSLKLDEVAVDTPKRITGVVPKSGEEITFDAKGGDYDPAHRRIVGTERYGDQVLKPLSTLDSVRLVSAVGDGQSLISMDASRFYEYSKRPKTDKIVAVVTTNLKTHRFWDRCRIDPLNRLFLGPFETGRIPSIPFDSVAYVRARVPDHTATAFLVTMCVVTVATSVYYAIDTYRRAFDNEPWF